MHRTFLLIVIFFACILSCTAQQAVRPISPEDPAFDATYAKRQAPVVRVKVLHLFPGEDSNRIIHYSLTTPFEPVGQRQEDTLDADGSFTLHLDFALPYQQIWLQVGRLFYGALYANEGLELQLDAQVLRGAQGFASFGKGIRYRGPDGPLNAYLNEYAMYRPLERRPLLRRRSDLQTEAQARNVDITAGYNRISDSLQSIQESFTLTHPSPYAAILINEDLSDYYAGLCGTWFGKTMPDDLWRKMNRHQPYGITSGGTQFYYYLGIYTRTQPPGKYASLTSAMHRLDSLFPPAKADFIKLHLALGRELEEQQKGLAELEPGIHTAWCAALLRLESRLIAEKIQAVKKNIAASAQASLRKPFSIGKTIAKIHV
jgi:hypothetical protein